MKSITEKALEAVVGSNKSEAIRVDDGVVLVVTREHLERLLAQASDPENKVQKAVIMVQFSGMTAIN